MKTSAERGLVALKVENTGCTFKVEVLPECHFPARYTYRTLPKVDRHVVANENESFELFVLTAHRLEKFRKKQGALRFDEYVTGRYATPRGLKLRQYRLEGRNCGKATHVVRNFSVGGFALTAGTQSALSTDANLFVQPPAKNLSEVARAGDPAAPGRQADGHGRRVGRVVGGGVVGG